MTQKYIFIFLSQYCVPKMSRVNKAYGWKMADITKIWCWLYTIQSFKNFGFETWIAVTDFPTIFAYSAIEPITLGRASSEPSFPCLESRFDDDDPAGFCSAGWSDPDATGLFSLTLILVRTLLCSLESFTTFWTFEFWNHLFKNNKYCTSVLIFLSTLDKCKNIEKTFDTKDKKEKET